MIKKIRNWFGYGTEPWQRPTAGATAGGIDVERATWAELTLLGRALATPARLAHRYRRHITARISRLERADRDYRMHQAAGEEAVAPRGGSARRLSTRQVLVFDLLILAFDASFYYSTFVEITGRNAPHELAIAFVWALLLPLLTIVLARHLGGAIRDRQDGRVRPADSSNTASWTSRWAGGSRRAPLTAVTLLLAVWVTVLLLVVAPVRFYTDASMDGGLGVSMTITGVALGMIFVAVPAFAVMVHAMHDPAHRRDMLRHARKAQKLASAHTSAWLALLRLAQDMMTVTVDVQRVVETHLAGVRAADAAMGAHPSPPGPAAPASDASVAQVFQELWRQVGQEPRPMLTIAPMTYNWTAFYPLLTALHRYPPPEPRTAGTTAAAAAGDDDGGPLVPRTPFSANGAVIEPGATAGPSGNSGEAA